MALHYKKKLCHNNNFLMVVSIATVATIMKVETTIIIYCYNKYITMGYNNNSIIMVILNKLNSSCNDNIIIFIF